MLTKQSVYWLLLLGCISCANFSDKKDTTIASYDTIVNFSKVDASPYFKECEKLLNEAKTNCFRTKIQTYFTDELQKLELTSQESVDEIITVVLLVDKNGNTTLKELALTETVNTNFPGFEASINQMIEDLPKLHPALKRGIPVTTEYKLPINIKVE